jgi:hypothetical protein
MSAGLKQTDCRKMAVYFRKMALSAAGASAIVRAAQFYHFLCAGILAKASVVPVCAHGGCLPGRPGSGRPFFTGLIDAPRRWSSHEQKKHKTRIDKRAGTRAVQLGAQLAC